MSIPNAQRENRNEYFSTNERAEAVRALEVAAGFLRDVETNDQMWTWAIIALHRAVEAFMVLALRGTWSVTVLRRDQRTRKLEAQRQLYRAIEAGDEAAAARANEMMLVGDDELASFLDLYGRIKDSNSIMRRYVHSREFTPRPKDDQCMKCLNDVRHELIHFVPQTRSYLLRRLSAMTETGLHVISYLFKDSNSIDWFPGVGEDDLELRAHEALARASDSLGQINANYGDLSLPSPPLCGSMAEKS